MDLSELQLKLEELGMEPDKIDEVLASFQDFDPHDPRIMARDDILILARENEKDWKKRAVIAAEIVKRGLDT